MGVWWERSPLISSEIGDFSVSINNLTLLSIELRRPASSPAGIHPIIQACAHSPPSRCAPPRQLCFRCPPWARNLAHYPVCIAAGWGSRPEIPSALRAWRCGCRVDIHAGSMDAFGHRGNRGTSGHSLIAAFAGGPCGVPQRGELLVRGQGTPRAYYRGAIACVRPDVRGFALIVGGAPCRQGADPVAQALLRIRACLLGCDRRCGRRIVCPVRGRVPVWADEDERAGEADGADEPMVLRHRHDCLQRCRCPAGPR